MKNLISEKNGLEALDQMKQVVQSEDLVFKGFLSNNLKLILLINQGNSENRELMGQYHILDF